MKVISTKFEGVSIVRPDVFSDSRGFFVETFQKVRYQAALNINDEFVQDNYSFSKKNVLRGMHFQKQYPQGKIVRVMRGEIFDVVVDIRKDSSTFGQWEGFILSDVNQEQLWVSPGFAHGFLVLSEYADFEYKCTDYYRPDDEYCLLWNDPTVNIQLPLNSLLPVLSEKDSQGLRLTQI